MKFSKERTKKVSFAEKTMIKALCLMISFAVLVLTAMPAAIYAEDEVVDPSTSIVAENEATDSSEPVVSENETTEAEQVVAMDAAQNAVDTAQAIIPEQESLAKTITQIDLLLPSYDELECKASALSDAEKGVTEAVNAQKMAQENKVALINEIDTLKTEQKLLANAATEKEKFAAQRQQLSDREARFLALIIDIEALNVQREELAQLQADYLKANVKSSRLLQEYETMNKAFLDEQAGIIASSLVEGIPCPVCGATSHPHLATLSTDAPTEAEVKKAKKAYTTAQKETEKASIAAGEQQGIVTTTETTLQKTIDDLLPNTVLDAAIAEAQYHAAQLSLQIADLDAQIADADTKIARVGVLTELIPQKEKALTEAEGKLSATKEQMAAFTASAEALKQQIIALREKLSFSDKTAAENEKEHLQAKLLKLKNALTTAENALNKVKENLAGTRATIEQLRKQLESGLEADTNKLLTRKNELTSQKNTIIAEQKTVHSRITTNTSAQKNVSEKQTELKELESKYVWMKALSDTANGNLSGKEKIMLETYIQTTYFDRILERANIRLQKMSGGQYDLKRRRTAANMRGQSGLELDIVDHINTTERSVNTLSGGEAFLASLALALGLSDEVQMSTGIRLDTMFVDEGFGSLDSEALSKAYATLAGLTEGNRLVGIISHVSELKERIDRQIVVTKEKCGGSIAKLVI
jgi:exonuclease SbcC